MRKASFFLAVACGLLLIPWPGACPPQGGGGSATAASRPAPAAVFTRAVTVQPLVRADVSAKPGELIVIEAKAKGDVTWMYDARDFDAKHSLKEGKKLILTTVRPGVYSVQLIAWDERKVEQVLVTVEGTVPPLPPDPKPPDPKPPDPKPPAPVAALRVLIVYESSALNAMPKAQQAIIANQPFRDFLDSKCLPSPSGKRKEWNIWDKDVATSGAPKVWQDLMARPRTAIPWLVVSNGSVLYEGPLPGSVEATQALISKYVTKGGRR